MCGYVRVRNVQFRPKNRAVSHYSQNFLWNFCKDLTNGEQYLQMFATCSQG